MADHWITTHWPIPEDDDVFCRHLYVQKHMVSCPRAGDMVFVREARTVKGKLRPLVQRHHRGRKQTVRVAEGFGGLIGGMSVVGNKRRPINSEDVVYDFGNLHKWSIVECKGFKRFELPLDELLQTLGYGARAGVIFLNLWRVPEESVLPLLGKIGR